MSRWPFCRGVCDMTRITAESSLRIIMRRAHARRSHRRLIRQLLAIVRGQE